MKSRKIYGGIIITGLVVAITIISCDKNLDKSDPNAVTVDSYFKNSTELLKGTNAIYSVFHSNPLVSREWFFVHDTRSDEVATGGPQLEQPRAQLLTGTHDPTNGVMNNFWNALYTLIHRANTVIENGPNVTDNTALRDRCVGEAKFLRGWAYFELVSMWGGVPLYTETVKAPDAYKPRAKEDEVYTAIVADLQAAATALPGKSSIEKGRATNAAANALLGRVLMQKGDYAGAKTALLKIPTSGADGYGLTDRYLDNFEVETEFNKESILEAVYFDKGNTGYNWGGNGVGDGSSADQSTVRNQEYCPVAWRNLIPSNKYLNEFENTATGATKTDPRYKFSVYESGDLYNNGLSTLNDVDVQGPTSTVNGVVKKASWRKFMLIYREDKGAAGFHPGGNNQRMIRYADVLLMLAECENEGGNIAGAIGYLNQVRARPSVAMTPYPTVQFPVADKNGVTKAIMHERMVELGDEEIRNIDISRWRKKGYFPSVAPEPLSYFVAGKHELLPLPQAELDNNPNLGAGGVNKQNPGY
ncbi:MAG: RagB/SusD family nutrient uptake outer membrane protein [Ferruginibacter sp.]